jgi:hypothetical protein
MLVPPALRKVLNSETLDIIDHACDVESDCECGHKPVNIKSIMKHIEDTYNTNVLIEQLCDNLKLEELVGGGMGNAAAFLRTSGTYDGIYLRHALKTSPASDCVYEAMIPCIGDLITGFAFPTFANITKIEIFKCCKEEDVPVWSYKPVKASSIGLIKISPFPLYSFYPCKVQITLSDAVIDMGSQIVAEYVLTVGVNRMVLSQFGRKYIESKKELLCITTD